MRRPRPRIKNLEELFADNGDALRSELGRATRYSDAYPWPIASGVENRIRWTLYSAIDEVE